MLDLIDTNNERIAFANSNCPNDPISGYSLKTIQKCMIGVTTIPVLKGNLKANKPQGVTNEDINLFFKEFEDRW